MVRGHRDRCKQSLCAALPFVCLGCPRSVPRSEACLSRASPLNFTAARYTVPIYNLRRVSVAETPPRVSDFPCFCSPVGCRRISSCFTSSWSNGFCVRLLFTVRAFFPPLPPSSPPASGVAQVIIPGSAGEYGVTAGHSPIVAELKPGVVQVLHEPVSFWLSKCVEGFAEVAGPPLRCVVPRARGGVSWGLISIPLYKMHSSFFLGSDVLVLSCLR